MPWLRPAASHRERGFTIIELLVVVLIIGVLAAIAIPIFTNQRARGIEAQVKAQVDNVVKAVETALADANGPVSGDHTTGAVTIAGHKVSVPTTDNVGWAVAGDTGEYCISAWSTQAGKYTPDTPLLYDSVVGRFLPEGVECGTPPEVPVPGDDDPEPEEPYADTITRQMRSVGQVGVFYDFTYTETPAGDRILARLDGTWQNTERGANFTEQSMVGSRWSCKDTSTGEVIVGDATSEMRSSQGSRVLNANRRSMFAQYTCPTGTVPYAFTANPDTADPWWVSEEYLEDHGWPTPVPDPYADIVAGIKPEVGKTTRDERSYLDLGFFSDIEFVTEHSPAQDAIYVRATMQWTRTEATLVGPATNFGVRCISPGGHLFVPTSGHIVTNNGYSSNVGNSGTYRVPTVACPFGHRPYDYVADRTNLDPVADDPWWVSDTYLELNGHPPAVHDAYLDAQFTLEDAQGFAPRAARSIDDKGLMESITFTVTQPAPLQFRIQANMTFTRMEAATVGSVSGRWGLRCITPGGNLRHVTANVVNSANSASISNSGSYRVTQVTCPEGAIPYDFVEDASSTEAVVVDPWFVSNRYVELNGAPASVSDPYLDTARSFTLTKAEGFVPRSARSIDDKGIMADISFTSTQDAQYVYRIQATMQYTKIGTSVGSVSGRWGLRCITPGGNLRSVNTNVVNSTGTANINNSGTYRVNLSSCPEGSIPYDYVQGNSSTDPVVADPWWVSNYYVELNGTPPPVADPFLDANPG